MTAITTFIYRHYSGPTSHAAAADKSRLHSGGRSGVYSPVIEIDDDSHSRFVGSEQARKYTERGGGGESGVAIERGNADAEDSEWKRDLYCQPRDSLLSLTADFLSKCSARLQEINKKGSGQSSDKSTSELLDHKCFVKLVDVAHALLKMAPYDVEVIRLEGLQKYMNQVGEAFSILYSPPFPENVKKYCLRTCPYFVFFCKTEK